MKLLLLLSFMLAGCMLHNKTPKSEPLKYWDFELGKRAYSNVVELVEAEQSAPAAIDIAVHEFYSWKKGFISKYPKAEWDYFAHSMKNNYRPKEIQPFDLLFWERLLQNK